MIKKCPECLNDVSDTANFCPTCGYTSKRLSLPICILGSISTVILLIVGIRFMFIGNSSDIDIGIAIIGLAFLVAMITYHFREISSVDEIEYYEYSDDNEASLIVEDSKAYQNIVKDYVTKNNDEEIDNEDTEDIKIIDVEVTEDDEVEEVNDVEVIKECKMENGKVVCPYCGKKNKATKKYCMMCGKELTLSQNKK